MNVKDFRIALHFQKIIELKQRTKLKQFIRLQLSEARKSGSDINFVFCSDEDLLEINRTHLNHDYYTDIITFDLSDKGSDRLISDIYISVDRVKDNANTEGVSIGMELQRVIFHGLLHLIGYKDKSAKQRKEMRMMEDRWLDEFSAFQG